MLCDGILHERRIEDRHVDAPGQEVLHDTVRGVVKLDLANAVDRLELRTRVKPLTVPTLRLHIGKAVIVGVPWASNVPK